MAIVVVGLYALKDVLPRRVSLGLVADDLVEEELGRAWRGVHGQVDADLPFEEADLVGCGEPRLAEKGAEEDAQIQRVDVPEVEFDLVGWVLCCACEVCCERSGQHFMASKILA